MAPRPAPPSPVALALNRARRRRGESLRLAAIRCGLPIRYLAAFELDRAPLVFRTPDAGAVFLGEYARYLGLDAGRLTRVFLARFGILSRARAPGRAGRHGRASPRRAAALGAAALVVLIALAAVAWAGPRDAPAAVRPEPPRDAPEPRRPELPPGGRRLFPDYRVVALYGSPITARMGRLGAGRPSQVARSLRAQAESYATPRRPVIGAFEIVTTVTTSTPGADGTHTFRLSDEQISTYLAEVRRFGGLLILDIQPGRVPFDREIRRYERWLRMPDVGVALDPEWRVRPGQLPGRTIGSVDAAELNRTIDYLARLVSRSDLPQKLVVIHQFNLAMITDRHAIHRTPELAVTFDFDGVGTPRAKLLTYAALARDLGDAAVGVKLYYDQDATLLTPRQVVRLRPEPDLVVYQ